MTTTVKAEPILSRVNVPYDLYRQDGGQNRFYYRPDTDRYYGSVTSVIGSTTPTPYALQQWMKTNGHDSDRMRDERAGIGTALHVEIANLLKNGFCDLDLLGVRIREHLLPGTDLEAATDEIKRAMLSFEAFRRKHEVEPIAVEMPLSSERGYAGTIDLVCRMRVGTSAQSCGFLKRDENADGTVGEVVTAIVDFKSGKYFYESHEMQLHLCRDLWNENAEIYGWDKAARVFNWAPSQWHWPNPTFKLKDQGGSKHAAKLDHLLALFLMDNPDGPPSTRHITGTLTADCDMGSLMVESSLRDAFRADRAA